jgi:hypothetical protein
MLLFYSDDVPESQNGVRAVVIPALRWLPNTFPSHDSGPKLGITHIKGFIILRKQMSSVACRNIDTIGWNPSPHKELRTANP